MTALLSPSVGAVDAVLSVLVPLTDEVPDAEDVNTGWWYVVVFFGLVLAVYLLWKSMRKQLTKIRFDEEPPASQRKDEPPTT